MTIREVTTIGAALALPALAADPIRVYAAGSLRAAMTELALAYAANASARPTFEFGASGLLRDRLIKGELADVFASANLEYPRALVAAGRARGVVAFTRNRLCALTASRVTAGSDTLLDALLDPANRLGTSTPLADPSGDYAWQLFDKAETIRPGARAILAGKARKLTGGPQTRPPPPDRSIYTMMVETGEADLFLTYCTNAALARRENPSLRVIDLPDTLSVGADYGIAVLNGAPASADAFVQFVLGSEGQRILAAHGFAKVH